VSCGRPLSVEQEEKEGEDGCIELGVRLARRGGDSSVDNDERMDEQKIRRWLEAGGYELIRGTEGYFVVKGGFTNSVFPQTKGFEVNLGTSLDQIVAEVAAMLPELGDPPTEDEG
jgi:hypothetical protein